MNKKIKTELTDKLFQCILSMNTVEECYLLFEDLCTINEIQAIAQRMEVASMLDAKCTYVEIAEKTGASTATISRVNRCLNYGTDGYRLAIDRQKAVSEG
ncbi:MAG: YerC/YecD family TrpR-related protein [Anaerotignum sp.]